MIVVPRAAISRKRELAKVGDLQRARLGHQHVGRPQIPVDDALPVRVLHRPRDLDRIVERPIDFEPTSVAMTVSRVSPGTYSITMKKTLSCFSAVVTATML